MNQRLVQYDVLKGIGILLVVICHAGHDGFSKEFIYTFHMPLFFFTSGCFFKNAPFGNYIVKNIKQLLIPYLLFAFCMIVARSLRSDIHLAYYSISGTFSSLYPFDESDPCLYESIWFLVCLFIIRIIYWLINRLCIEVLLNKLFVCCALYILGYIIQRIGLNLPFFIDTAFSAILFYFFGEYFHSKGYDKKTVSWWWSVIGIITTMAVCYLLHPYVELKDNKFPFYLLLLSTVTIISLYYICKYLVECNDNKRSYILEFLEKSGVSSLSILGLHNPIIWILAHYLHFIPAPPIVLLLLLVFITVVVILCIEKILYKTAPFLLGKF